ncbi:MAG: hypothetical protein ACYDGR_05605 [Candidatus Dormibacteria bacterium]
MALVPAVAEAATGAANLTFSGGALSVGSIVTGTLTGTITGSTATATGNLPQATWIDPTGSGAGWHGTIAMTLFNYNGSWVTSGTALTDQTSANYTGSGSGAYKVSVVSDTAGALVYNVTGLETLSNQTATNTSPVTANVGTHGVTIDFKTSVYLNTDSYIIHVGNLAATATALNSSGTSGISANSGTTSVNPIWQNNTSAVNGVAGAPTTAGTAVPFVTAAVLTGMGSYNVQPPANVSFDPSVWAAQYSATATYTITSGP